MKGKKNIMFHALHTQIHQNQDIYSRQNVTKGKKKFITQSKREAIAIACMLN